MHTKQLFPNLRQLLPEFNITSFGGKPATFQNLQIIKNYIFKHMYIAKRQYCNLDKIMALWGKQKYGVATRIPSYIII